MRKRKRMSIRNQVLRGKKRFKRSKANKNNSKRK
jgi:hypothetical protein